MARGMTNVDALRELQEVTVERNPVVLETQVFWQVNPEIGLARDGVIGVLQLLLVHVDGNVSSSKILQPTGMI